MEPFNPVCPFVPRSVADGCHFKVVSTPLVGLLSVVAMHLLQLKTLSVSDPARAASTMVPPLWLTMLKAARGRRLRRVHDITVYDFYREVAKLGGFLGRRSDGEPGWITIWRLPKFCAHMGPYRRMWRVKLSYKSTCQR